MHSHWEPNSYSIIWNFGGYPADPGDWRYSYTIEDEYTPNDLDWKEKSFVGWKPSKIEKGSTGTKRFTAIWTTRYLTVEFYDSNRSEIISTKQVAYGKELGKLPKPDTPVEDNGYQFDGWIDYSDTPLTKETIITEDIKAYQKWVGKKYIGTFNSPDGDPESQEVE